MSDAPGLDRPRASRPAHRRGTGLLAAAVSAPLLVLCLPAVPAEALVYGQVRTNGANLNVRSCPATWCAYVGYVENGARVPIYCQTYGEEVTGTMGTSRIWDRIGSGRYVADAYVDTGSDGFVTGRC